MLRYRKYLLTALVVGVGISGLSVLAQSVPTHSHTTINTPPFFKTTLVYRSVPNIEHKTVVEEGSSPESNQSQSSDVVVSVEEEVNSDEEVSDRLAEIERLIHENEGTQPANSEAVRPDTLPNHTHPDLFTGESSSNNGGFELLDFTNSDSTFDILGWDIQTRTAQIKDWRTNPENEGLQPHVARFKEEVAAMYGITSFSLYRPGDPQDHGKGLAVDFMVPVGSDVGDKIASYALTQMYNGSERISYVIWEQHIWGDWSTGWEPMEDRGSITQNHYDHVHVSFYP